MVANEVENRGRFAADLAERIVRGDADSRDRAQLALVCRRSGVAPEILLDEAPDRLQTA